MSSIAFIGVKSGMMSVFDSSGKVVPLTLINVDSNVLIGVKSLKKDGYNAFVLAGGIQKEARINKPQLSIFKKVNALPRKFIKEFRVEFDLSDLSDLSCSFIDLHIVNALVGKFVDVIGVSSGKGFQGGMKRHGFKGMNASHGVSVTHRHLGSTGQRELPGKTFKNKKMPGHMGSEKITIQNLKIFDVNVDLGIIAVVGSIPGYNGSTVYIRDSVKLRSCGGSNSVLNGVNLIEQVSSAKLGENSAE